MAAPTPAAPAAPPNGKASAPPPPPEPIAVPVDVVVELLNVALGSVEGQRVWRVWCRTTPAIVALGPIGVRINTGPAAQLLTVVPAPE